MHHETSLPATSDAGRLARAELDGWLSEAVGERVARSVRLATTELVANAVRHAELPPGSSIRLFVDVHGNLVHVHVDQASPAIGANVVAPEDRGEHGGFGLAIVDGVADRWGIEVGPPGSVWFEVRDDG